MAPRQGEDWLHRVYRAKNADQLRATYDGWAATYDDDLTAMGYRYPAVLAGLVGRYVATDDPILDAGAGTGIMGEVLSLLGYAEVVGIDISERMLEVARSKGVYARLEIMMLGGPLDFADDSFAAVVSTGVLTMGHAPAAALDELVRVTRRGGHIIYSLTQLASQQAGFGAKQAQLEAAGRWRPVEVTTEFVGVASAPAEDAHPAQFHVHQVD